MSNHDELMSNFFAQADALALGKTPIELRSENVSYMCMSEFFLGNLMCWQIIRVKLMRWRCARRSSSCTPRA